MAPDSIQVFFILVGLWAAATAATRPEIKFYVLNGLAAGLAAAVKYIGVFAVLPLIVAHIFARGWLGTKRRSLNRAYPVNADTHYM
jgi:4-amino-4-deoxy-L-arabinose transferase-like glycosyltransferase